MVAWRDNVEKEIIQTIQPGGKKGIRMPAKKYDELKKFIFSEVSDSREVTLVDLLERVKHALATDDHIHFFLLYVKVDLEARGYLKAVNSEDNPGQLQKCIRITSKGLRVA